MMLGGYSATGPRDANEDNYYFLDFAGAGPFSGGIDSFVLVSDGMGGYQGGDVASALVVSSAESYLSHLLEMGQGHAVELNAREALREIVQNAHDAIVMEAQERGSTSMGATFVGAFMSPNHAWIAHVGDSRAYLIRDGAVTQLTEDHSQVGRMLSRGLITEREAQTHPARNRIEKALGFPESSPDIDEVELRRDDALLLCSDGVYTVLAAADLGSHVDKAPTAAEAARSIVAAALEAGTDDNSTVVVARRSRQQRSRQKTQAVRAVPPADAPPSKRRASRRGVQRPQHARGLASNRRHFEERMPNWAVFLLLAAMIVMILLGLLLVTMSIREDASVDAAGTAEHDTSVDVGSAETEGSTPVAGPAASSAPHADDAGATNSDAPEAASAASNHGNTQFSVKDGAVLKYVDGEGTAQMFSYEPLAIAEQLTVAPGSLVSASNEERDYGRPSRLYRSLDRSYLEDLQSDCAASLRGATGYSSRLSALFEKESYRRFVSALAAQAGAFDASGVNDLILDSSLLVSRAAS